MGRAAEKVLAIISVVFTGISILLSFMLLSTFKLFYRDEALVEEFEMSLISEGYPADQVDVVLEMLNYIEAFSWFFIAILVVSLIATIVGLVFIWNNKNPKLAGVMFIIGGLFAYVLSLTSIMLYIAGILCFTRKGPLQNKEGLVEESADGSMRPL